MNLRENFNPQNTEIMRIPRGAETVEDWLYQGKQLRDCTPEELRECIGKLACVMMHATNPFH